jgi:hypothetical protein
MRLLVASLLPTGGALRLPPAYSSCDPATPEEIVAGCAFYALLAAWTGLVAAGVWCHGSAGEQRRWLLLLLATIVWAALSLSLGHLLPYLTPDDIVPEAWPIGVALLGFVALSLPSVLARVAAAVGVSPSWRPVALFATLGLTILFLLAMMPFALVTGIIVSGGTIECFQGY